ncbi:hypothetical protein HDZ31DRAFT_42213 [Schizophyllum fasciatum]
MTRTLSDWHNKALPDPPSDPANPHISPINALPIELLADIFGNAADGYLDHYVFDSDFVPFTLTHVCKLWRDVAVDMPILWQRFELRPCVGKGKHTTLASICVQRARGRDLSILYHELYFDEIMEGWFCDTTDLPKDVDFCDCPLDFIIDHISLVKHLQLTLGGHSISRLAEAIRGIPVAIEALDMAFLYEVPHPEILAPLYSSPNLKSVRWSATDTGRWPSYTVVCPTDLVWHHLDSLEFFRCPMSHEHLMDILASASSLQCLKVQLQGMPTLPRGPVRHSAMRSLAIRGDSGPLDDIFSTFSFPSLQWLFLSAPADQVTVDWPFQDVQLLVRGLEQLQDGLEEFSLTPCGAVDETTLIRCLQLPQMLRVTSMSLEASRPMITDRLIAELHPDKDGRCILPNLECVILYNCATADGSIARMLRARRALTGRLKTALVTYIGDIHPLDERVLWEFRTCL